MHDFTLRLKELVNSKLSMSEICNVLRQEFSELSKECIRSRVRRYYNNFNKNKEDTNCTNDFSPVTKNVEYRTDGSLIFDRIIELSERADLTPNDMLLAHGMDPLKWEILSYKNNLWQTQKKGGQVINLYQSKITVKPKQDPLNILDIQQHFETFKPNTHIANKHNKNSANLLYEVNIADLHLGKFAEWNETFDKVNSSITQKRFFNIIDEECKRLAKIQDEVEQIIFVWSNDFFNSDGISKSTTGGTLQDTDMKWQNLFLLGVELLVTALSKLSLYAPVKTFYIASNHSRQSDFYAINYLYAWFRNNDNVIVDVNPHPRYYYRYGCNLIGFAHSYYEKKENLPYLMSIECKKDWSETSYREYHLAHYHCEKVEEKGGIIFRWLPSVTGADSWSNDCGYVGAVKRSYSFVYDKKKGLVQMNCTIVE